MFVKENPDRKKKKKNVPLYYQLTIIFKSGRKHGNPDSMSCLLLQSNDCEESSVLEYYVLMTELCHSPAISEYVARYSVLF